MLSFGFFALVLVLIFWVNRAVRLFDQLIASGESALVFLEFSIMMLPLMIALMLPVATFVGTIFVTNRLSAENELVVAQTAGYSPFRIARPVLILGVIIGLFSGALHHVLVPLSQERLVQRQAEVAQNITARFLTEGTFIHPADGITVYIREISREGEMLDIFLSDTRSDSRHITYSAERALVVRSPEGPRLVMFEGMAQILTLDEGRLTVTSFEDFTYDLAALIPDGFLGNRSIKKLTSFALWQANPAVLAEVNAQPYQFRYQLHSRTGQTLLPLVTALIGFSTLLLGAFSRFGLWRQILGAVVLLAGVQFLDNEMGKMAAQEGASPLLVYIPSIAGLALVVLMLWLSANLSLLLSRQRRRALAQAQEARP